MYLAFDSTVHIHETNPPDNQDSIWVASQPIKTIVPSTSILIDSNQSVVNGTQQTIVIYEFETTPEILTYSVDTGTWKTVSGPVMVLCSSDNYVLKDQNDSYLLSRKGV